MKNERRGNLLIMAASVAWSFSGMLSKWSRWGALSLVGARALVAVCIFALVRRPCRVRLTRGNWLGASAVAVTSVLFIFANKLTSAANAIVIQYAAPMIVMLMCAVIYRQRPGKVDIAAAVITLCGVILCFVGGLGGGNLVGDGLALLSAFTFAAVFFVARMPGCDPLEYTFLGNLLSCAFLLFIPLDPGFSLDGQSLFAALAMGLCLAAGYLLFSAGLHAGVHPVAAAILSNIEPVLNPIWAYLVLGEQPGPYTLLGALGVLASVTVYSLIKTRGQRGR